MCKIDAQENLSLSPEVASPFRLPPGPKLNFISSSEMRHWNLYLFSRAIDSNSREESQEFSVNFFTIMIKYVQS